LNLRELLTDIDIIDISCLIDGEVASVCYDSRKCKEGSLFVAVPGFKSDGHDFINSAVAAGAKYIVVEKEMPVPEGITVIEVRDARRALGLLGRNFYRNPSSELCIIGVTGTNGKTTTTFLLESILKSAGARPGVIGTINYRYGNNILPAPNTTPESLDLQRILREMADAGVSHVIMEVSSHALDLGRVDDCQFQAGIFTNLTQDHLDYHKTMEEYFQAKKRLFEMLVKGGNGAKSILNIDDPWVARLQKEMPDSFLTCAIDHTADFSVFDIQLSVHGIKTQIQTQGESFAIQSPLIGKFNLYNILSAVSTAYALKIPVTAIQDGIKGLKNIPGRMEKVSFAGEPSVFVDYAHTDDALRRALQNIAEFKEKRVITVFGCGGDRDSGKRPLMGKVAVEYSDLTILTSDNPRSENPATIIGQIEQGINGFCRRYSPEELDNGIISREKGYCIIADRRAAIHTAIALAGSSDIVLIAGKGHENYQIIGNEVLTFDDRVVSREIFHELKAGGRN
jgi:UDP-N-acetylmuramoyl-L-alanyl-D-glutamate--2,6-diaminopimelate ligase